MSDIVAIEKKLGYTFRKQSHLDTALTHSSYANETRSGENNERYEFLGDAVLSIVVSDYLFKRYHMAEGDLTRVRATLVCEKSLCEFARKIGLGAFRFLHTFKAVLQPIGRSSAHRHGL